MSWSTIFKTSFEYAVAPIYDTFKSFMYADPKKDPGLHCLITVIQLGEIWDREADELRIKFENNQIVYIRKVDSTFDFKRSRDDIFYLQGVISKALEMFPPTTEELRDFYERGAKGLETLRSSYEKEKGGKTVTVCAILQQMITQIRNALKGILSKEEEASSKKPTPAAINSSPTPTTAVPIAPKVIDLTTIPIVFKMSERHLVALRENTITYVGKFKTTIDEAKAKFLKLSVNS